MNAEAVDLAVEAGYRSSYTDMPRVVSRCEWAEGTHAFLAILEKEANLFQSIVIRAAMGWITDYRRRHKCITF